MVRLDRCSWGKFSSKSLQHSGFWQAIKIWLERVLCISELFEVILCDRTPEKGIYVLEGIRVECACVQSYINFVLLES